MDTNNTNIPDLIREIFSKIAALPTRQEIENLLEQKVSLDRFTGLENRVQTLENSPKSFRDWLALGISGGGCLLSIVMGAITIAALLASHWR